MKPYRERKAESEIGKMEEKERKEGKHITYPKFTRVICIREKEEESNTWQTRNANPYREPEI